MATRHYVNLTYETREEIPADRCGREVFFKFDVDEKDKPVPLLIRLVPGKQNHVPRAWERSRAAGLKARGNMELTVWTKKGYAIVLLIFSEFGGDQFTVNAWLKPPEGEPEGEPLFSETFEVWRRLYCQITPFGAGTIHETRGGGELPAVPELNFY